MSDQPGNVQPYPTQREMRAPKPVQRTEFGPHLYQPDRDPGAALPGAPPFKKTWGMKAQTVACAAVAFLCVIGIAIIILVLFLLGWAFRTPYK